LPDVNDLADYLLAEHRLLLGLAQETVSAAAEVRALPEAEAEAQGKSRSKTKAKSADTQMVTHEAAPAKRAKQKTSGARKAVATKAAAVRRSSIGTMQ
jgi:hypothetical protein